MGVLVQRKTPNSSDKMSAQNVTGITNKFYKSHAGILKMSRVHLIWTTHHCTHGPWTNFTLRPYILRKN
jgi:hypothetical protein